MIVPSWSRAGIPPCICRILAKKREPDGSERMLTDEELMKATGWGERHLRTVYRSATWQNIKVGDMDLFLQACGLHPSKQRRYKWLLQWAWRNGMDGIRNMKHLRTNVASRVNQRETLLRMVERVLENEQQQQRSRPGN